MQPMVEQVRVSQGCHTLTYTSMNATLLQGVSFVITKFLDDVIFIKLFIIIYLRLGRAKRHCEVCISSSDRGRSSKYHGQRNLVE